MRTYRELQQELQLEHELPVTADWSAAADFLCLIKDCCLEKKPATIVECSSGLTTLVLSRCCQINNKGHVYSLENGEEYQLGTQRDLQRFELMKYADVIYAPLKKVEVNQQRYDWYKTDGLADLEIDMLVIDGPPGFIQRHSRLPALPLLLNQLSDNAVVFMDDAARDDEKEIVRMWLELDARISHEYIETERGCSVLKINQR